MSVIIGSARIDENGKIVGGAAGDQTGKEVSTQNYYPHKKGWKGARAKKADYANKLAIFMLQACNNNNIGYGQDDRLDIISSIKKYGSMERIAEPTEADCGTLVRGCCILAGKDPGDFTTANAIKKLVATGEFEEFEVNSEDDLYDGDILCTKTKGHIVIVVSGKDRVAKDENVTLADAQKVLKMALNIIPNTEGYVIADAQTILKKALKITDSTTSTTNTTTEKEDGFNQHVYDFQWACNSDGIKDDAGNKLKQDGLWGPKSTEAAGNVVLSTATYGKYKCLTAWVQIRIGAKPDGYFGEKTRQAVVNYQTKKGLKADGLVGSMTLIQIVRDCM